MAFRENLDEQTSTASREKSGKPDQGTERARMPIFTVMKSAAIFRALSERPSGSCLFAKQRDTRPIRAECPWPRRRHQRTPMDAVVEWPICKTLGLSSFQKPTCRMGLKGLANSSRTRYNWMIQPCSKSEMHKASTSIFAKQSCITPLYPDSITLPGPPSLPLARWISNYVLSYAPFLQPGDIIFTSHLDSPTLKTRLFASANSTICSLFRC